MSQIINAISKISSSCNCREVCDAPERPKKTESARLLCGRNISVGTAEVLFQLGLVEENRGSRSRERGARCEGSARSCAESN